MMWKPVIGKVRGYQAGGQMDATDTWNAGVGVPDPTMYRNDAKNMANVKAYIEEQGGSVPGQRQKPTAADVLGKFQAGMQQEAEPEAPMQPTAPVTPTPPQRTGPSYGMNLDNSLGLSSLSAPSSGLSGIGLTGLSSGIGGPMSKLGRYARGGKVMDYRQGGPVAGGPPGVDTVPAMLNNGEYVLPRPTTQAMGGKPVLDQVVLATTGKPPVGYAQGSMPVRSTYDQLRMRGQDVGNAVDRMTAPPPTPQGFSGPQYPAQARTRPAPRQSDGVLGGGMPGVERQYANGGKIENPFDAARNMQKHIRDVRWGAVKAAPQVARSAWKASLGLPLVVGARMLMRATPTATQEQEDAELRKYAEGASGYADGGRVSGWNVNRAKQIEDAVNGAVGAPQVVSPSAAPQAAPLLSPEEQAWMEMQRAKEAEQAATAKPAWKKMLGMARGGEVQGYARGGGPLSSAAQAALDEFNARVAQQRAVASAAAVAGPKPINMGGPAPTTMVEPPLTPRSAEYIRMQPAAPAPQAAPAPSLRDVGPRQPSPEAQRYIAAREVANARMAASAPAATSSAPATGWNRSINIPGGQMATNLVKGAAGLLKNNVIAAPAIGGAYSAYESATNPEAVNAFRESVGAETPWQNVGADALRTLGNIGNTATFGMAGRLGQGIANVIGGQSFFTPEAAAAQPAPVTAPPADMAPPQTPIEVAAAETQAAIMDPTKSFAQVPGAARQGLEYAPNYEKTITPGQPGARYSGPQGYMEYAGPAAPQARAATDGEILQDLSAPAGSRLVASGGVRGMGDGSSPLGFDKATMDAANANIRRGGGGGSFSVVGGAPAGVDDAAYAAMSPAQKSAAKVASLQQQWQAVRGLRNVGREAEGLPRVEQVGRGTGLKPSEQIALANLQRNLSQDEFMNRLRVDERLEGRQKARNTAQDRYLEQAAPFAQKLSADFPWMAEEAPTFFQQAATIRPTNPAAAVNMLAGVQQALAGNNEPLFKLGDIEVTGAQAAALLNGEGPFNTWMPFGSPNAETYKALRQRAAQEVQRMALRELGR